MRARMVAVTLTALAVGWRLSFCLLPGQVQSEDPKSVSTTPEPAEVERLQASAIEFAEAFNRGDAKAIAIQFTEDAEAVDEEGSILKGRDAIQTRFAELFQDYPQARVEVELTSLRQIGADVALEDGYSTTTLVPNEPGARSPYTVVHLKRDGKWQIASVRDFPAVDTPTTAHDALKALGWLVGQWVDESPEGRVETRCEWSEGGNYLLQHYTVKSRWGGQMHGSERIAWDLLRNTIRSWAFDDSGAFTEAFWTPLNGNWIVEAMGEGFLTHWHIPFSTCPVFQRL
ncbi:YybH family protein [Planctomicrobium sp. SH661]|uniref:YybH family protein n=1 Tax=Planctomicrobium sp. SH661 TaxID=3448124 RepID=UPI003F5B2E45